MDDLVVISEEFDELVYFYICEVLYSEKNKSNYQTFNGLCYGLKNSISNGNELSSELYAITIKLFRKVEKIYNLNDELTIQYIRNFLKNDMWKKYVSGVATLKTYLKFYTI